MKKNESENKNKTANIKLVLAFSIFYTVFFIRIT